MPSEYVLGQSDRRLKKVFVLEAGSEIGAVKFDVSALPPINGKPVTRLAIHDVRWACSNTMAVRVLFDRGTPAPAEAMILAEAGKRLKNDAGEIKDKGTGNTGDIQFTTVGAGTYWVEMEVSMHTD